MKKKMKSIRVSEELDRIWREESQDQGMSQTAYVDMLIRIDRRRAEQVKQLKQQEAKSQP